MRLQTKMTKITFVFGVCQRLSEMSRFPENHVTRTIVNTENGGGVRYNHDFQSHPPDQRMTGYGHVTNLPRHPSCPGQLYRS